MIDATVRAVSLLCPQCLLLLCILNKTYIRLLRFLVPLRWVYEDQIVYHPLILRLSTVGARFRLAPITHSRRFAHDLLC